MNEEIEEIQCITDVGKTTKNEWENDNSDLYISYTVYITN